MTSFYARTATEHTKPKPTLMFSGVTPTKVVTVSTSRKSIGKKVTAINPRNSVAHDSSSPLSTPPVTPPKAREMSPTTSKDSSSRTATAHTSLAKTESERIGIPQPRASPSPLSSASSISEWPQKSEGNNASRGRKASKTAADALTKRNSKGRPLTPPSNASSSPLSSPPVSLASRSPSKIPNHDATRSADSPPNDVSSTVAASQRCEREEFHSCSQGSSPLSSLSSSPLSSVASSPRGIPAKRKLEPEGDLAQSDPTLGRSFVTPASARKTNGHTSCSSPPLSGSFSTGSSIVPSISSTPSPRMKSMNSKNSTLAVPRAMKMQRARSSPSSPTTDSSIQLPRSFKRARTTTPETDSTPEPSIIIAEPPALPRTFAKSKLKRSKTDVDEFDDSDASAGPSKIRKAGKARRKRLTDTTLPPKRGTHNYDERTALRGASPLNEAGGLAAVLKRIRPPTTVERKLWDEKDGDVKEGLKTSTMAIEELMLKVGYSTYFRGGLDGFFELKNKPTCMLEYPASTASDEYLLAKPKDPDHYDPTLDIEDTLATFIRDYLPQEYRYLFGPLPEDVLNGCVDGDDDDADVSSIYPASTAPPSTVPSSNVSASSSRESSPLSDAPLEARCHTSPPQSSSVPSSPSPTSSPPPLGLMRALDKARKTGDGPAYLSALDSINLVIRSLKNDPVRGNILASVPHSWAKRGQGIPESVVHRIIEETYQRCVGPKVDKLRDYKAFSSNVYGELTPAFVSHIIALTGLHSECLFLDLGSGVGNVCLQVALQTGCKAFGIEQREDTAEIANDQERQIRMRCRMWGVSMGEVELVKGDMTASPSVDQLMSKADVVLVNNYVFSESLNASIAAKFLDLKDDAIVISLKPFQTGPALTERNFDDIAAIFTVTRHPYREGTVSWSGGGGIFYAQQVDRDRYRRAREHFEEKQMRRVGRARRGRSEGA